MNIIQFPEDTDSPNAYNLLSKEKQKRLQCWISTNLKPYELKTYNEYHSSCQIRNALPFYVTNGEFKGAMLAAGFTPKDSSKKNWVFKISKRRCNNLLLKKKIT